jgi:hypothetical protein
VSRVGAEFTTKFSRQRLHDKFGLDAAERPDLIDERITMDRRARKIRYVRDFFVQADDGNVDAGEASLDQGLLDRIDLTVGERHVFKGVTLDCAPSFPLDF